MLIGDMNDKQQILEKLMPRAVLRTLTTEAKQAVPQSALMDDLVPIRTFPFRVGRESRVKIMEGRVERMERQKSGGSTPNNDLYLIDDGHLLNISREHFQIEKDEDRYYLYDRGSACGTQVEGQMVGGNDNEEVVEIRDGDTIIVGTGKSPYIFEFITLDGYQVQSGE